MERGGGGGGGALKRSNVSGTCGQLISQLLTLTFFVTRVKFQCCSVCTYIALRLQYLDCFEVSNFRLITFRGRISTCKISRDGIFRDECLRYGFGVTPTFAFHIFGYRPSTDIFSVAELRFPLTTTTDNK